MIRKLGYYICAVGLLAASGTANASSCESVLSSFQSCNGSASCEVYYTSQHPECFAGGSTTSTTQINATTFTQANAISQAISSRSRQTGPGLSLLCGCPVRHRRRWHAVVELWASHSEQQFPHQLYQHGRHYHPHEQQR